MATVAIPQGDTSTNTTTCGHRNRGQLGNGDQGQKTQDNDDQTHDIDPPPTVQKAEAKKAKANENPSVHRSHQTKNPQSNNTCSSTKHFCISKRRQSCTCHKGDEDKKQRMDRGKHGTTNTRQYTRRMIEPVHQCPPFAHDTENCKGTIDPIHREVHLTKY